MTSVALSHSPPRVRTRAKSHRRLTWFLVAAALLLAAYCALWFYAAGRAGREMDAWMAGEARQGRTWTCSNRQFTGFPVRFTVGCRALEFKQDRSPTTTTTVSTGPIEVSVALYDPNRLTATIGGPLRVTAADGTTIFADWHGLRLDAHGLMQPDMVMLHLSRPQVRIQSGNETKSVGADDATLGVRVINGDGRTAAAAEVRIAVAALQAPALDQMFESRVPASIDAAAILTNALALRGRNGPEAMERWRVSGGQIESADVSLGKGAVRIGIKGQLDLDAAHRPRGALTLAMTRMDLLMKELGLPAEAINVSGLFANLLGDRASPSGAGRAATTFPLRLDDGLVSLGPIPLPVKLEPLY